MTRLRGPDSVDYVKKEMDEMAAEKETQTAEVSYSDMFKTKRLLKPLICTIVVQLAQQFSGINAVSIILTVMHTYKRNGFGQTNGSI